MAVVLQRRGLWSMRPTTSQRWLSSDKTFIRMSRVHLLAEVRWPWWPVRLPIKETLRVDEEMLGRRVLLSPLSVSRCGVWYPVRVEQTSPQSVPSNQSAHCSFSGADEGFHFGYYTKASPSDKHVHTLHTLFFHLRLFLPNALRFKIADRHVVWIYHLPCACFMCHPSHTWFYHPNNIRWSALL
jgi:hypothetical protein